MHGTNDTDTQRVVQLVLGVARLGERSLRGWWRSHGLDRAGKYVLEELFPRTWPSAALELDINSAAVLHDELLGRPSALHLFSDQLPFRRWAKAWLAEQKTVEERDPLFDTLESWDESTAARTLRDWSAGADVSGAELLGTGLLLGAVSNAELDHPLVLVSVARRLAAAYLDQDNQLRPPYLDLVG